jgi:hypothetical protein
VATEIDVLELIADGFLTPHISPKGEKLRTEEEVIGEETPIPEGA